MIGLLLLTSLASPAAFGEQFPAPSWQSKVIAEIETVYAPFVATQGMGLEFKISDERALVVASAHNDDGVNAKVVVTSGLVNSPRLTPDSLRMTICHELGHIFGGAPRRNVPEEWTGIVAEDGLSIMSSEGQADYYAAMICFPRVVRGQNHAEALQGKVVNPIVQQACAQKSGAEEGQICLRSMTAGMDFLNTVTEFKISFETPSTEVATQLDRNSYPSRQCRLDILVAASLCQSQKGLQLDRDDAVQSGCETPVGRRPVCWYPAPNL